MRFPFILTLFLLFAPFTNVSAHSEEMLIKSLVKSVTVFPSGAQVVRSAELNLVAGDHTIIIQDLPERLITSSLRVEGAGGKTFEIGAVDSKHILVDSDSRQGVLDKNERQKLENEIERLGDERDRLKARIANAETQRQLMERLAGMPGEPPLRPLSGANSEPTRGAYSADNWSQIFVLIGSRIEVANDLIHKFRLQYRKKNKEITRLKKRLTQQPPKKERQTEVRVAISAPEQMKAGLKIKYQVREASWRPFYDARLTTGQKGTKPHLSLIRRAGIRQWSGEDWTNVKIALSTTRPQQGAQAPVLHPRRLDLVSAMPASVRRPRGASYMDKMAGGIAQMEMAEDMMPAPAPMAKRRTLRAAPKPARERRAKITQYAFQAVFEIPGLITVLPTGDEKKVAISSDELEPSLKIKTVPKLNATAFLYAKFTHAKKATPLLPGSVALYRDGTFSGNGVLPLINAGDEHALGFGTDDAVKVTRAQVRRTKGQSGIFSASKGDELRYKIKVTNLHDTPVDIEVVDQIPYSVNEKVVVRLLPSSTKPSRQNIKDRRGILAWNFTLGAGKDKQINLDYTVSWPADRTLSR